MRRLAVGVETWPIAGRFVIARGAVTEIHVVTVGIAEAGCIGRGECRPYARYGEAPDMVVAEIEAQRSTIEAGIERTELQNRMKPGAARNAIDCALWDLVAKQSGKRVWELAGLPAPRPVETAYTISVGTPTEMAAAALRVSDRALLKVKLSGAGDLERIEAVRAAAPASRLIVDANEAWTPATYRDLAPRLADLGVALIEQPLPAADDTALGLLPHPVPLCADESAHDRKGLEQLARRYDAINIKLDKTGGLTEGIELAKAARGLGLSIMIGCMVGTSLAMAPALLLANEATFVDLDGPLLLARDRAPGLTYEGSLVMPPPPELWG
jgi:L-alanine-DL-glutamate epimerase-like enolase superfamily enzyme